MGSVLGSEKIRNVYQNPSGGFTRHVWVMRDVLYGFGSVEVSRNCGMYGCNTLPARVRWELDTWRRVVWADRGRWLMGVAMSLRTFNNRTLGQSYNTKHIVHIFIFFENPEG
jgi:hypothetical protein